MRLFYLSLCLLGCLLFPGVTYADYAYEFTSGDLKYGVFYSDVWDDVNETWYPSNEVEVTGYTNNHIVELKVPSSVTNNGITFNVIALGFQSFSDNQSLASIEIPSSIKVINSRSFERCYLLQNIKLSEGLEIIGGAVFEGCKSLKTIDLPSTVKEIYLDYFDSTYGCFSGCSSLEAINVSESNTSYASVDGVLYDKLITTLLLCPQAKKSISLPTSLTHIYMKACESCQYLTDVIIPDKVEIVGEYAFNGCQSMEKVKIGKKVNTISNFAFAGCESLKEIEFGNNLETIEGGAFWGCGFESLTLPSTLKNIYGDAFTSCGNLTKIIIPSSLEFLGEHPFIHTNLKSVDLSDTKIETLSSGTFNGCYNLATIYLPETLKYISGNEVFEGCLSLRLLECNALNPPAAIEETFEDYLYSQCSLAVPSASLSLYKVTSPWSNFKKIIDTQYIGVSGVSIYAPKTVIGISETLQLSPIVSPSDAESPTYTWEVIENIHVAEIDDSGLVKPLNPGKVVIKLTAENYAGIATAEVEIFVVEVGISNLPDNLHVGDEWQLYPQISPAEFENEEIIWLSSDPQIISINNNGVINAISAGVANISISLKDYSYIEASYKITVDKIIADRIEINSYPNELMPGESYQLEAIVYPEETTDQTIIWSSSNEKVATVSDSGLVTAVSVGEVIITATCGEVSAECQITVLSSIIEAEEIVLNTESTELNIGEVFQIEATVLPEDATNKTIIWTSSNENIATVSDSGLVTAVSPGEVTIIATCGEASAECGITVLEDAGVERLLANPENKISIYTTDGILIKKDCKVEDLKTFNKGIYIIVSGKERYKISI